MLNFVLGYTAGQRTASRAASLARSAAVGDGKVRHHALDCPSCQSKVTRGLSNCQFCGTAVRAELDHPLGEI